MNKTLIALALFGAVGAAHATKCADGLDYSAHPEGRCDWYYAGTDPTKQAASGATAGSNATAGATAGALAGSLAANDTRVVVDASGAPVSAEARQAQRQQQLQNASAVGGGLSGTIGVNGGTNNYNSSTKITTLVLPPLPMGPALPAMTTSSSTYERTACMPNKIVWREPVLILVRNSFGPDTVQQIGWDESLRNAKQDFTIKRVPVAYNEKGEIIYRDVPYGTQALIKTDLMNAASGTSFAFGGIGKSAGGQVGGTDQGSVQRYVTAVQVFECPLDLAPAKVIQIETFEVEVERKKIGG